MVPAPLRHCGRAFFFGRIAILRPKNGGFEGFEMKSMVEKHAKSLQGFAEEVIFDNLANTSHVVFSSLCRFNVAQVSKSFLK